MKVGVAYVNVRLSRRVKEELIWVIDNWLWIMTNKMLFETVSYTTKNLKNKAVLNWLCIFSRSPVEIFRDI